jgi:hypothetical protein
MRKRRTPKEQQALYELWQQSGLSKTEFCRQNHISTRCMWRWCREFGVKIVDNNNGNSVQAPVAKDIKFYPIGKVSGDNHKNSFLEITLPNGINCKAQLSEHRINGFLLELFK